MRGVGDEAAQLPLGGLARAERGLDLRQHRVQREPEPTDLRALVFALDPAREVAAAIAAAVSPIASSGRRPRRTSHSPSTPIATRTSAVTINSISEQTVEGRVDVVQRGGDDEHRTRSRLERSADAVSVTVCDAGDGEVPHTIRAVETRSAGGIVAGRRGVGARPTGAVADGTVAGRCRPMPTGSGRRRPVRPGADRLGRLAALEAGAAVVDGVRRVGK